MEIECSNCGKVISGEVVRPMEWSDRPFCSWWCVLGIADGARGEYVRGFKEVKRDGVV